MDRRLFFRTMIGGVAASSAVRTWPFRVFSFPTELRIFSMEELRRIYLERAMAEISRGGGAVEGVQSGAMKGTRRNFSGNPVYQELTKSSYGGNQLLPRCLNNRFVLEFDLLSKFGERRSDS